MVCTIKKQKFAQVLLAESFWWEIYQTLFVKHLHYTVIMLKAIYSVSPDSEIFLDYDAEVYYLWPLLIN